MEKGFSTSVIDRNARIREFVRLHNLCNAPALQIQLSNLKNALRNFVEACSVIEKQLTLTEGMLRSNYSDWDAYQMLRDGLENLSDAFGMS